MGLRGLVAVTCVLVPLAAAAAPAERFAVAGALEIVPLGRLRIGTSRRPLAVAYGVGAHAQVWLTDWFALGVAPRVLLNVRPADEDVQEPSSNRARSELDLRLRADIAFPINATASVFGFVAPGYSRISESETSSGLTLGGGVGCRGRVNERVFLQLELGFQYGLQSKPEVELATMLLHVGLGVGKTF